MTLVLTATTIVSLALLAASIILNSFGIYLMKRTHGAYTNQKLILIHLSSCHIHLAISRTTYTVLHHYEIPTENYYKLAALGFIYIELSTYYLIIISLTVDRFVACKYPLRYAIVLSRKKMRIILATAWILGLVVNLPQLFISAKVTVFIFNYVTLPVLDFTFILTAVAGYGYLLYKLQKRKRDKLSRQNGRKRERSQNYKFIKMAAMINLRFFLLVIIPDIIFATNLSANFGSKSVMRFILVFCWYVNPVFDPVTYVFMQKGIRRELQRLFETRRENTSSGSGKSMLFTTNAIKSGNHKVFDTKL